jgi:DNA-binding response OmpR family regulator
MASILLIEDDEFLVAAIRAALLLKKHEVIEARDGKEAIAQFNGRPFDLIITDILLPEKDGLELIPHFRRKSSSVKIIAMSGGGRLSPKGYLEIARKMGANATLVKPFSAAELHIAVNKALNLDSLG